MLAHAHRIGLALAVVVSAVVVSTVVATAAVADSRRSAFHFAVTRSLPAPGQVLEQSPEILRVWFSQPPAAGVSQLALMAGEKAVKIGRTTVSDEDKLVSAPLLAPLAPGAYRLRWRGAGDDGHVQSGEIPFTVEPPAR